MERRGRELVKIPLRRYRTLVECVFASFKANGPMTDEQLFSTLPHYRKSHIRKAVAQLPDELTGRG